MVSPETELVVVCIPDPPSIRKVIAIAEAAQEAGAQLLLFNPRLASGDNKVLVIGQLFQRAKWPARMKSRTCELTTEYFE